MGKVVRVGTRESKLALVQSEWVISEIKKKYPELEFELVPIKTKGDIILDKRLDKLGGKGLFIKELENALINKTIDMAVHSMKDMPSELPKELIIAAVSKREDPRDVLVTSDGRTLDDLPPNAVIGTSSVRREVQILNKKPGFTIKTLRGNVLTRVSKLTNCEYDALILAKAGLKRLGLEDKCAQCFEIDDMIPAVGQGALAVEARADEDIEYLIKSIHDEETAMCVSSERAYMKKLNGSCSTPIAAHAVITGNTMRIYGMYAEEKSFDVIRESIEGKKNDAVCLGEKLADIILERRKS